MSTESRYELKEDNQGRLFRLDRVTGEVVLLQEAIRQSRSRTIDVQPSAPRIAGRAPRVPVPTVVENPQAPVIAQEPVGNVDQGQQAPVTAIGLCGRTQVARTGVTLADAPVFAAPENLLTPLTTLVSGVLVPIAEQSGDWLLIRFEDLRWGSRAGYVHCSNLRGLTATSTPDTPPQPEPVPGGVGANSPPQSSVPPQAAPQPTTAPPGQSLVARNARPERIEGYAE